MDVTRSNIHFKPIDKWNLLYYICKWNNLTFSNLNIKNLKHQKVKNNITQIIFRFIFSHMYHLNLKNNKSKNN